MDNICGMLSITTENNLDSVINLWTKNESLGQMNNILIVKENKIVLFVLEIRTIKRD